MDHATVEDWVRRYEELWRTPGTDRAGGDPSDEEGRGAPHAGHLGDLLEAVVVDRDDAPLVVVHDGRLRRGGQHASR